MAVAAELAAAITLVGDADYAAFVTQMLSDEGFTTPAAVLDMTDGDWRDLKAAHPRLKIGTRRVLIAALNQPQQQRGALVAAHPGGGAPAQPLSRANDAAGLDAFARQDYRDSTRADQSATGVSIGVNPAARTVGLNFVDNDFSASRDVTASYYAECRTRGVNPEALLQMAAMCPPEHRAAIFIQHGIPPQAIPLPTAQNLGAHLGGAVVPQPTAFLQLPAVSVGGGPGQPPAVTQPPQPQVQQPPQANAQQQSQPQPPQQAQLQQQPRAQPPPQQQQQQQQPPQPQPQQPRGYHREDHALQQFRSVRSTSASGGVGFNVGGVGAHVHASGSDSAPMFPYGCQWGCRRENVVSRPGNSCGRPECNAARSRQSAGGGNFGLFASS